MTTLITLLSHWGQTFEFGGGGTILGEKLNSPSGFQIPDDEIPTPQTVCTSITWIAIK